MTQREKMRVRGSEALMVAQATGEQLHKHADPTESARPVTLAEARELAQLDASLIWLDTGDTCFCHGCGERVARVLASASAGEWYCDGCKGDES